MSVPLIKESVGSQPVTVTAIQSRKLIPTLGSDMQLLGGETPNMFFAKDAQVQPVFAVGSDPQFPTYTAPADFPHKGVSNKTNTAINLAAGAGNGVFGDIIQIANPNLLFAPITMGWWSTVTAMTGGAADTIKPELQGSMDGLTWVTLDQGAGIIGNIVFPYFSSSFKDATQGRGGIWAGLPAFLRFGFTTAVNMVGTFTGTSSLFVWVAGKPVQPGTLGAGLGS